MKKFVLPVSVFFFSFFIFILTLAPDVTFTDSGELAASCVTLGICHPTGYPLFTILGHLWTQLPIGGSAVYKLNLLAALFTALSAYVIYFGTLIFTAIIRPKSFDKKNVFSKYHILSAAIALGYAFARTIWDQGTSIEVYSLHIFLLNLTIYFILRAIQKPENALRNFVFAGFTVGLGFANHLTTILIIPSAVFVFLFPYLPDFSGVKGRFRYLPYLVLAVLLGVSLYIYLPLRSASYPIMNWGWVHRSFGKFLYHVSGKQYQVWMFTGWESFWKNIGRFFTILPYQFAFIGLVPVIVGFVELYKKNKSLFWFFFLLVFVTVTYAGNYSIHDIDSYFSGAIIGLTYFSVAGFLFFEKRIKNFVFGAFLIPVLALGMNYKENDKSSDYLVHDYTMNMLKGLDSNAIIISAQWDYFNSALWYYQYAEGIRTDIAPVEKELLRRTWYPMQFSRQHPVIATACKPEIATYLNDLDKFESGFPMDEYPRIQKHFEDLINGIINKFYGKRPIYITLDVLDDMNNRESPLRIAQGYKLAPSGLAFKLVKDDSARAMNTRLLDFERFATIETDKDDHLVIGIKKMASVEVSNIGRYALYNKQYDEAKKAFELALRIMPREPIALDGLQRLNSILNGEQK